MTSRISAARCRGSVTCRSWVRCSAPPNSRRQQTELVIIITPHLVTPTRGEALALPTDRIRPPTESQLFLFGQTAAPNRPTAGAAGEVAQQDFGGSYGYVMED